MTLLTVREVHKRFGGVPALQGASLTIEKGEILGLIGPNGSGKTTLFNCISGFTRPDAGNISFKELEIAKRRPDQLARLGIGRTFQQTMVFPALTVWQNLAVIAAGRLDATRIFELLEMVGLSDKTAIAAKDLPFGDARRLGIALALYDRPELLLLDEPAAGLSLHDKDEIADLVRTIQARGTTVCVVDHDMVFIMPLCDRIVVMAYGTVLFEGIPSEVGANSQVIDLYLGRKDAAGR